MKTELIEFQDYKKILERDSSFKNRTMYHEPSWLKLITSSFGTDFFILGTFDKGKNIKALTPYMKLSKGPFTLLGSPLSGLYTEHSGPLFSLGVSKKEEIEIFTSQHNFCRSNSHYIELGLKQYPNSSLIQALREEGYKSEVRTSSLVDLSKDKDVIWDNLEGRARNMIRKAEKNRVITDSVSPTTDWIKSYYHMLEETFSKQGKKCPHPISFFQNLMDLDKNNTLYLSSYLKGEIVANAIFLIDGRRMFYLSGTSNLEGMKSAANSSIQWHAIKEAISKGILYYDMGGLGIPSIDKFKRSFGGKDINSERWVYRSASFSIIEPIAKLAYRKGFIKIAS